MNSPMEILRVLRSACEGSLTSSKSDVASREIELTPMIVTEPNGTQWCNWCDRRGRVKISYKIEND